MIRPTVQLNGTARQELLQQMIDARNAIQDAVKIQKKALPHARDYQGNQAQYLADRQEAEERIAQAQDLAEAYYQDAIALTEATS